MFKGRFSRNFYLKYRYIFFKKFIKPTKFGKPTWEENFNNPSFKIEHDDFYAGHSYIDKECVLVKDNMLYLKVIPTNKNYTRWGETQFCNWRIGKVSYQNLFEHVSYGTWSFEVKIPKGSFAALWFLRYSHPPVEMQFENEIKMLDGKKLYLSYKPKHNPSINWWLLDNDGNILSRIESYDINNNMILLKEEISYTGKDIKISSDHIVPEVDLMELMRDNRVRHTIHHGFVVGEYRKYDNGTTISRINHDKFYEFTLKVLKDRYEFYIDGIKTCEYDVGLYDKPLYPILNNAVHINNFKDGVSDFIVKSIKYYKHDEYGNINY